MRVGGNIRRPFLRPCWVWSPIEGVWWLCTVTVDKGVNVITRRGPFSVIEAVDIGFKKGRIA